MYKHFEYELGNAPLDIEAYYRRPALEQHGPAQERKSALKLRRIERLVLFRDSDTVLDCGCGSGALLGLLAGRISKGVGVDVSEAAIARAPRLKNLTFMQIGRDGSTDFADACSDKVLLIDVLEHVLKPEVIVAECRRVLRQAGQLVVEVLLTGLVSELVAGRFHEGHLRYYDPDYLRGWLTQQGLLVRSVATYNSVPLSKRWLKRPRLFAVMDRLCGAVPSKWYPWFGEIIAVCTQGAPGQPAGL